MNDLTHHVEINVICMDGEAAYRIDYRSVGLQATIP